MHVVSFGEALWDLLPSGAVLGGAPLNFAFRIGSLGHRSSIITALGADELGDKAMAEISALNIDTTYIQRIPDVPTGTVDVILDENSDPDYVINAPAAYDVIHPTLEMTALVSKADCFCFGSLIQRTNECREVLRTVLDNFGGKWILYDVNLRKDCYSKDIVHASLTTANIAKLNHEELAELSVMLNTGGESISDQVSELMDSYSLSCCLVTLGPDGAYAASADGKKIYSPAFYVERVDPCGAGDAFTAGFIHGLLAEGSLERGCELGNAMGSLVTGHTGATGALSMSEIEQMTKNHKYQHVRTDLLQFSPDSSQ